ncbi:glutathione S-transferase [Xylona heveae TC161]|uniref:Glutathione S-transferase n=1 Tax=Xylona heveae (strain CBS 132557 / TC161) TaxID=1328760 RepID=A0A165G564_XYLHT|nr:glutathione S-transferase [Xylona heveae TC161]KZF21750.1 glutathione S-transferase [Xylona heveae TC161]
MTTLPVAIPETDIVLYTDSTPNGQKVSIVLEELGLKYETKHVDISKNVQKEDWYLRINPNGKVPAIVDKTLLCVGQSQERRIFEGGAILLYLTQRYDPNHKLSYPQNSERYWEMVQWLIWMQSSLGPMQGQSNHFYRYAPEKIPYAIDRYQTETKRLYSVLEELAQPGREGPWLVGNKCTIADLACFSWVNWAEWAGVDVKPFKLISDWLQRINQRPAVQKGLNVPRPFEMKEKMKTKVGVSSLASPTPSHSVRAIEATVHTCGSTNALSVITGGRKRVCREVQSLG